ncbi:actin-like protein arp8 [Actinomortierella ambigua]|nr:actin-like protein arp8 [Actinomortierella ambigua]
MEDITMHGQDGEQQQQQPATVAAASADAPAQPHASTSSTIGQPTASSSATISTVPEPMDVDMETASSANDIMPLDAEPLPTRDNEDVSMDASSHPEPAHLDQKNQSESTPSLTKTDGSEAPSAAAATDATSIANQAAQPQGQAAEGMTVAAKKDEGGNLDATGSATNDTKDDVMTRTTVPAPGPVPPTISVTDTSSSSPSLSSTREGQAKASIATSEIAAAAAQEGEQAQPATAADQTLSSTTTTTTTEAVSETTPSSSLTQPPTDEKLHPTSTTSTTTTTTSSSSPTRASPPAPSSSSTANASTAAPASASASTSVSAPPYRPQFRFTTFASVAALPTRNVTSSYLKSERHYVLRERAATGDRNVKTLGKRRKKSSGGKEGRSTSGGKTGSGGNNNNNNGSSSNSKQSSNGNAANASKEDEDEEGTASGDVKRKKTIFELFNEYDRQGGGGGTEGETEDENDEGRDERRRRQQGRRGGSDEGLSDSGSSEEDEDEEEGGSEDLDSTEDEEGRQRRRRRRRRRAGSLSDSDLDMEAEGATSGANEMGGGGAEGAAANAEDAANGAEVSSVKPGREIGSNVIVIHPGSRNLRIGRASDAYPIDLPHVIARRIYPVAKEEEKKKKDTTTTAATAVGQEKEGREDDSAMDVDKEEEEDKDRIASDADAALDEEDEDIDNFIQNPYLEAIEYDLRSRMKAAKRRPVPNAKSQVRSFNASTRPEEIKDHNDPHKVEWTDPEVEDEKYFIGQKALNLPPSWLKMKKTEEGSQGSEHKRQRPFYYEQFWPIIGGKLNDRDYDSLRVVMADLERIWTRVIQDDLKIEPRKLGRYYALLIIPDMYNKTYVTEMIGMLLNSMRFRGVMVQQEAVCATFGAGVSAACVVDIGAEVTKVSCVEDGICLSDSRAVLRYGGDDITRCFTSLVRRNGFPYQDLVFSKRQAYYDWRLMEELKEKWCTMNEADLTVQVYTFFVRKPDCPTLKYQLKIYDEVALSPSCLFFPGVIGRPTAAMRAAEKERYLHPKPGFLSVLNDVDDANEEIPPAVSVAAMFSKKSGAGAGASTSGAGGAEKAAAAAAAAAAASTAPTATQPQASPAPGESGSAQTSVAGTPVPSSGVTMANASANGNNGSYGSNGQGGSGGAVFVPTYPFGMDPSVQTTNMPFEAVGTIGKDDFSTFAGLDVVVAQSIANCRSEERSKKLYSSIILVGGGGMTPGFDRVLEDRLFQALPASLTTVEKVEVLPSPRDLDPRLLVWKGASVLSKLDTAKELWIKPQEWLLLGKKILRERALFAWQ